MFDFLKTTFLFFIFFFFAKSRNDVKENEIYI